MEARAFPLCLTVKTPISYFYANLGRIIRDLRLRIFDVEFAPITAGRMTGGSIAYVFDAVRYRVGASGKRRKCSSHLPYCSG